MTTTEMNSKTSSAVRAELVAIGTRGSRLQRHQRRSRAFAFTISAVALGGALTGAAVVVNNLPGSTTVTPLGSVITVSGIGTAAIDLGPAPSDAGAVVIDLTCLTNRGSIRVETIPQKHTDGAATGVDCSVRTTPVHVEDGLLPPSGSTSITVTADSGTGWKATVQYASSSTTPWGVNAKGQTYGVPNVNGVPDLSSAYATNGKLGYVVTKDMFEDAPVHVNVYESDGTTIIGRFDVELAPAVPVTPPPGVTGPSN
jgi:hypothetical protein